MYPYGSGMPNQQHHHQQQPPPNNSQMPHAPFGAGFYANPNPSSHSGGYPYPSNAAPGGYPSPTNPPYPNSGGHSAPYPAAGGQAPYPAAGGQAPYPAAGGQPPYPSPRQNVYPSAGQPAYPNAGHAQYPSSQSSTVPYPHQTTSTGQWNQSSTPAYPTPNQYPPATAHNQSPYPSHQPPPAGYPSHNSSSPHTPSSTTAPYPGNPYGGQSQAHIYEQISPRVQSQSHSSYPSAISKGTPTVTSAPDFDANRDAHALRKAMKGFGTDENALINIICRRSNQQLQEVQRQYKTHFGKDLIDDIKSETSGNFENLLVGLLRPIVDFYCTELCTAMSGIGTDEDVLIEILCTLSNTEIHTIKNAYLRMYGAHLESELKSETSGNFKRLLVSLCCAARDESGRVDPIAAQNDARELLNAGELRVGTDESMFNMILCQRNYQQLKMILDEYANITGHSLEKAIKREFSGDIQEGLLAICKCVTNKSEYFASRLHKSMAGIGTNDQQLIRVIVTRCAIDMQDIKVAFERLYEKSLKSWIKGDTSGHYKHALYALIGEQRSS